VGPSSRGSEVPKRRWSKPQVALSSIQAHDVDEGVVMVSAPETRVTVRHASTSRTRAASESQAAREPSTVASTPCFGSSNRRGDCARRPGRMAPSVRAASACRGRQTRDFTSVGRFPSRVARR
jgi:hypothetical protein